MGRFKVLNIKYNDCSRQPEELIAEGHSYAKRGRYSEAVEIAAHIIATAHKENDEELFNAGLELMRSAQSPCSFKPDENALQASDDNNRPYGAPTIMEEMAENSPIPNKTNNPRRFTLRDDYKEKMLYLIYLTWFNKWYVCTDGKTEPSATDVYYWFGVLLDYRFDNKTGKLSEIFDKGSDKDLYKLATELNDLSVKMKDMADNAKMNRKRK